MFGAKKQKNKKEEQNQEVTNQLNSDLIVHNMPKANKLSGLFSSPASLASPHQLQADEISAVSPDPLVKPKHNFKAVGLIIIAGGLIFIVMIVYLSYRFIIFPTANQNKNVAVIPPPQKNKVIATSTPVTPPAEITPATTTDLSEATTTTVSAATSSEIIDSGNLLTFPDGDNDGLNDGEEAILGTNATSTDTDSDTYSDSAEVLSGYDPIGNGKLAVNTNLATYTNATLGYDMLYPKAWPIKSINNDATVIFTAPDDSLIQISSQDNPDKAGILSWYEESFPDITVTYDKVRSTYSWEGIMGSDGLNFYLIDKKRANIFVISYISAIEGRVAYPNIFQLMINSLFIK